MEGGDLFWRDRDFLLMERSKEIQKALSLEVEHLSTQMKRKKFDDHPVA